MRYQYAGGWGYETGLPPGELYDDSRLDGGLSEPRTRVRGRLAAWAAGSDRASRRFVDSDSGVAGGVDAVDADTWGRPDEFRPPDDGLGLAGVNSALPPIRLLHVGWRWYDPSLGRFV